MIFFVPDLFPPIFLKLKLIFMKALQYDSSISKNLEKSGFALKKRQEALQRMH
jgi:hypothetical protein